MVVCTCSRKQLRITSLKKEQGIHPQAIQSQMETNTYKPIHLFHVDNTCLGNDVHNDATTLVV